MLQMANISDPSIVRGQKLLSDSGYITVVNLQLHNLDTQDVKRAENIKKLLYSIPLLCTAGYTLVIIHLIC